MSEAKSAPVWVACDDGSVQELPGLHVKCSGRVAAVDRALGRVVIVLNDQGDIEEFELDEAVTITVCKLLESEPH